MPNNPPKRNIPAMPSVLTDSGKCDPALRTAKACETAGVAPVCGGWVCDEDGLAPAAAPARARKTDDSGAVEPAWLTAGAGTKPGAGARAGRGSAGAGTGAGGGAGAGTGGAPRTADAPPKSLRNAASALGKLPSVMLFCWSGASKEKMSVNATPCAAIHPPNWLMKDGSSPMPCPSWRKSTLHSGKPMGLPCAPAKPASQLSPHGWDSWLFHAFCGVCGEHQQLSYTSVPT